MESASARSATPSGSASVPGRALADQLQLLPALALRGDLEVRLAHAGARGQRVGAAALVIVVAGVVAGTVVVLVVAGVVAGTVVVLVVAGVVAGTVVVLVVAGVVAGTVVVAAVARGARRVVALDLGVVVDGARQLAAAGEADGQHAVLEGLDRARVLLAVLDPVVVGVLVTRVRVCAVLAAVVQTIVVLVTLGLLDLERQVMRALPAVGQPVVVAITALGRRRGGDAQHGHEGQGEDDELSHGRFSFGRSGVSDAGTTRAPPALRSVIVRLGGGARGGGVVLAGTVRGVGGLLG